jgi:outer membrane protein assembly factor BamD
MKKNFLLSILISLFFGLFLGACATTNEPSQAYKGQSSQQIFQAGKTALLDNNYSEAIKHFEALDVQYPFVADTEQAQLYLIYAYYMKEEYVLSAATADRFIRIHPLSPHVDYAYYMRGMANYYQSLGVLERMFSVDIATRDLQQIKKAYASFSELTVRFPYSNYTPAAHQYMIYLRNVIAEHELETAQYYYNRKAYIASANRASELVAHYQGSPAVIPALEIMANSYRQLGMTKLEADTRLVMRYNNLSS